MSRRPTASGARATRDTPAGASTTGPATATGPSSPSTSSNTASAWITTSTPSTCPALAGPPESCLRGLENGTQLPEILAVGAPHGGGHERAGQLREAGRLAAVAQRHPGRGVAGGLPGVRRLHRERPLRGPHHEPPARNELGDLVGVSELPAQELRGKGHARPRPHRRLGLPPDR